MPLNANVSYRKYHRRPRRAKARNADRKTSINRTEFSYDYWYQPNGDPRDVLKSHGRQHKGAASCLAGV